MSSDSLPTAGSAAPRGRKRKWLLRLVLGLTGLLALLAIGGWVARDWLRDEALSHLRSKLADSGLHLDWKSAHYIPLRGLVLEEVTLYRAVDNKERVATCDNIGIDPGLGRLVQERSLKRWKADVSVVGSEIVLFDMDEAVLTLAATDLAAEVSNSGVDVAKFDAVVSGLAVSLQGEAKFPDRTETEKKPESQASQGDEPKELAIDFSPLRAVTQWLTISSDKSTPQVEATFGFDPASANKFTVDGRFEGEQFSWRTTHFDRANIDFAYILGTEELALNDLEISYAESDIKGGDVRYSLKERTITIGDLKSNADLISLARSIAPDSTKGLSAVRFISSPDLSLSGRIDLRKVDASDLQVSVGGENQIAVVPPDRPPLEISNINGELKLADERLSVSNLSARVWDALLTYRGKVDRIDSTQPLFQGAATVKNLQISRVFAYLGKEAPFESEVTASFEGRAGKTLESLEGSGSAKIQSKNFNGELSYRLADGVLSSDAARVSPVAGGNITFNGRAFLTGNPVTLIGKTKISDVPLQAIATVAGADREFEGTLSGDFDGRLSAEPRYLDGAGSLRVANAHLYHVPIIGAVEHLLHELIPQFGESNRDNVRASFAIADGVVTTDDLVVVSDGTRLSVSGAFNLPKETTDFKVMANLDGIVGLATGVVGKILEIRGTGSLKSPKLALNNVPVELAKNVVGIAATTGKSTVDIVGQVGRGGTDIATGTLKSALSGADVVREGLQQLNPFRNDREESSE